MSLLPTKKEIMDRLLAKNTTLKVKNMLLVELVEMGYKEAARANCYARKLGDIGVCIEGYWLSSNAKKELDNIKQGL